MWKRKSSIKLARPAFLKAGVNAYRDRRNKKRSFRGLFLIRINAAVRPFGLSYSKFMDTLKKANIEIDRKILSTLAKDHPAVFAKLVEKTTK